MRCTRCGTDNPDDNRFCDSCGASFVKICGNCQHANRTDARFCGGCGKLLGDKSPGALSSGALSVADYTPQHLAARIIQSRLSLEGERKQVTVLFADIRGSMELIEGLDPEDALERLDPTVKAMMDAVHRYEGVVNRVQGDGIMALFGAPIAHEDHAVRACLAAKAMLDAVGLAGRDKLTIRVGLNSGEVVVRSIGNDLSMDYDAVGATVHLAHRVEQLAVPGTACLTADTLRLAAGFIEARPLGSFEIKGVAAPIDLHELTAAIGKTRWEVRAAADVLTPFVGRDVEMAVLAGAQKRAGFGRGQVVAVVGEPGVGKSRLVHEFLDATANTAWIVLRTSATPYDRDTPFLLVSALLRFWLGVDAQDGQGEIDTKLIAVLTRIDPQLLADMAPLRSLLDLPVGDTAWDALDPSLRRRRIRETVKMLMLKAASVTPLVIVAEDLHWIDLESQAVFNELIDGLGAAPVMLLVTYRPEYRHEWANRGCYSLIRVDPLEIDAADQLLCSLIGGGSDLAPLRRLLIERTDGTPFFLEEIVHALIETGILVGEQRQFRLTRSADQIEIPKSVQAVLAARIDRLSPEGRMFLQIASVIGKEVQFSLLMAVVGMPETHLRRQLADLQALEFLYEITLPSGTEHTFKHALTRDVAYDSMLLTQRRTLHAQVMAAIEETYPDRLDEFTERLADHALRGEVWDKAAEYCFKAGQRANHRSAHREAVAHFRRALDAMTHLPNERETIDRAIDVRLGLRVALGAGRDFVQMRECLGEAEELAKAIGEQPRLGAINVAKCTTLSIMGFLDEAIEAGRLGRAIAKQFNDESSFINASYALGQAYWYRGDLRLAEQILTEAVPNLTADLRRRHSGTTGTGSVLCLGCLANTYAFTGQFEKAFKCSEEAVSIAQETKRPYDLGYACIAQGLASVMRGNIDAGIVHLEEALQICRAGEIGLLIPATLRYLGRAYALAGRPDDGRELLEVALEQSKSDALGALEAWCGSALAVLYLGCGMFHQAEAMGSAALDLAQKLHYGPVEVQTQRLLSELYARRTPNDLERAELRCREALVLAEEIGMMPEVAHGHALLAEILARQGHAADARKELAAALQLYRSMGMEWYAAQVHKPLPMMTHPSKPSGGPRRARA